MYANTENPQDIMPIDLINDSELRTFEQAERETLLRAMRFLHQRNELKLHKLVGILGVNRHAVRRRLLKHGLTMGSPEVTHYAKNPVYSM